MKKHGVKKGDRVTIYMPMIPEAAYAMLACARIGAIHSIVFGGFLAGSAGRPHRRLRVDLRHHLRRRVRGGKPVPLKENTDTAIHIAAKPARHRRQGAGGAPHRRQDRLGAGPRPLVPSGNPRR
jgi:acetyl-CoA synthetase